MAICYPLPSSWWRPRFTGNEGESTQWNYSLFKPQQLHMSDSLIKPTLYPSARDIRTITWTNLVPGPYPVHNNTVIFWCNSIDIRIFWWRYCCAVTMIMNNDNSCIFDTLTMLLVSEPWLEEIMLKRHLRCSLALLKCMQNRMVVWPLLKHQFS